MVMPKSFTNFAVICMKGQKENVIIETSLSEII